VVHANYLVNIGREQSIKRLKIMMFLFLTAASVFAGVFMNVMHSPLLDGLTILWVAGVVGAILSITNRLQSAISRDAMTEDGIYELTGLRVGWVGILTSIIAGGAFALVMYFTVMAGVLNEAYPVTTDKAAQTVAAPVEEVAPIEDAPVEDALPPETLAPPPATLAIGPETVEDCADNKDPKCASLGTKMAKALGLKDRMNFFKMLILAFLAGFAERLVPDILSRLSKRQQV
jgi:hypothetical protein